MNDIDAVMNIFDGIYRKYKTSATLNATMKALINNQDIDSKKALALYSKYYELQDNISHMLAIKACVDIKDQQRGRDIIEKKLRNNHPNNAIKTAMIDFYGQFGDIQNAQRIFNSISKNDRDVITIGAMMRTYVINGDNDKAMDLYTTNTAINDNVSHILALKACINGNNFEKGKEIHAQILNSQSPAQNINIPIELKNTLIDLYGSFGDFKKSLEIFNQIPNNKKQIDTINAMMNSYCISKMDKECIKLFQKIGKLYYVEPSMITYAVVLKACTQATMYHIGQDIHEKLKRNRKLEWMLKDVSIQLNLINLYGKCGMFQVAQDIFNDIRLNEREKYLTEIRIWNSMIKACARNAEQNKARRII